MADQAKQTDWGAVIGELLTPVGLIAFGLLFITGAVFGVIPRLIDQTVPLGERIFLLYFGMVAVSFGAVILTSARTTIRRDLLVTATISVLGFVAIVARYDAIFAFVEKVCANSATPVVTGPSPVPTAAPTIPAAATPVGTANAAPAVGIVAATSIHPVLALLATAGAATPAPKLVLGTGASGWMFAGTVIACPDAQAQAGTCSDNAPDRPFVGDRYVAGLTTPRDGSTTAIGTNAPVFSGSLDAIRNGSHGNFLGYVLAGSKVKVLNHVGAPASLALGVKAYQYWIQIQTL